MVCLKAEAGLSGASSVIGLCASDTVMPLRTRATASRIFCAVTRFIVPSSSPAPQRRQLLISRNMASNSAAVRGARSSWVRTVTIVASIVRVVKIPIQTWVVAELRVITGVCLATMRCQVLLVFLSPHRDDSDCHPDTASFLRHGHGFSRRHEYGLPEHDGSTQRSGRGPERAARRARSQQPIQRALFTDLADRPWPGHTRRSRSSTGEHGPGIQDAACGRCGLLRAVPCPEGGSGGRGGASDTRFREL